MEEGSAGRLLNYYWVIRKPFRSCPKIHKTLYVIDAIRKDPVEAQSAQPRPRGYVKKQCSNSLKGIVGLIKQQCYSSMQIPVSHFAASNNSLVFKCVSVYGTIRNAEANIDF